MSSINHLFSNLTNSKPHIALIFTGGTIAGKGKSDESGGYTAGAISGDEILNQLFSQAPEIAGAIKISTHQIFNIDSSNITAKLRIELINKINNLCRQDDIDGIVIAHGTDTMQESAYMAHLLVNSKKPVIFTGSMRPATALSADGDLNLLNSLMIAAASSSHGQGVLIVMDENIYSARDTIKIRSTRINAFNSPHGTLGIIINNQPRWFRAIVHNHTYKSEFANCNLNSANLPKAVILSDFDFISEEYILKENPDIIILAGYGAGTIPKHLTDFIIKLREKNIIVIRTSRVGEPAISLNAQFDDSKLGVIAANDQNPLQAKILATAALLAGFSYKDMQEIFYKY